MLYAFCWKLFHFVFYIFFFLKWSYLYWAVCIKQMFYSFSNMQVISLYLRSNIKDVGGDMLDERSGMLLRCIPLVVL
jgi:hypothetical protein